MVQGVGGVCGKILIMDVKTDKTTDAPRELGVFDLAQSHAKEIRALTQAVANVQKNRNQSQSIPHYMRRRAASHNANRLPQEVRKVFEKYVPDKNKRPSRYYRRRPKNLMEEYAKRQRRVNWLETHLWHAKRFHMVERWGYKLPHYSTEKGERSAHRAVTRHCLIQDQSYINCIEVKACETLLLDALMSMVSASEMERGSLKSYSNGQHVLYCTLHQPALYPAGAICPVEIMFNPQPVEGKRQVWIWCHCIAVKSAWNVLCQAFNVKEDTEGTDRASSDLVTISNLQRSLVRFKLNGECTFETLTRAITPINTNPAAAGDHVWWTEEFADIEGEITTDLKSSLKQWYRSNGNVATVRARDPRLCMPSIISFMKEKRVEKEGKYYHAGKEGWGADWTRVAISQSDELLDEQEQEMEEQEEEMDEGGDEEEIIKSIPTPTTAILGSDKMTDICAAGSALWSEEVRSKVSGQMMSQHEINKRRSEFLVPGSEMSLGDEESCVPLILVVDRSEAEVILPANWGLPFWIAFMYSGARPGGLREEKTVSLCTSKPYFPTEYPDTLLCQQENLLEAKALCTKHHKYPPNKRPNFDKLRTNCPFWYDWSALLAGEVPVVLRDRNLLKSLSWNLSTRLEIPVVLSSVNLVRVSVQMVKRGFPQARAEICLPTAADVSFLRDDNNSVGPTIQPHKVKCKRSKETHSTLDTDKITPSREVVGYVTVGRYSLERGCALGHGFVALKSVLECSRLEDLVQTAEGSFGSRLLCLVRALDSKQYRFALISVVSLRC